MKTIFEKTTQQELIQRIKTLNENSTAQWGKMNVYQMLKHCTDWEKWIQGKGKYDYKLSFIGRLFGKMALKSTTRDDTPLGRNAPTSTEFIIKEKTGDLAGDKQKWISFIEEYDRYFNPGFVHVFFGKMTKEQIGILAYKHSDHHLRQFNA